MKRNLKYLMILLIVALFFGGYQYFKHSGLQAYRHVSRSEVKLDSLPNGKYEGSYKPFNVMTLARVQFRVKEGKVRDFSIPRLIVSPWNTIKPAITDSIKNKQSLRFDAISGATRSSYFIKAALHNAGSLAEDPTKNPTNDIQP